MKVKILVLSINVFFFLSCNSKETNGYQSTDKKDDMNQIQQNQDLQGDTSKVVFIDNDEFVFKLIENELSLDSIRKNFREIRNQVIPNKYDSSLSDTIFVFSNGIDTVNFYVSIPNVILQEASINSQEIALDNDIKIGVSKDVFRSKFNLKNVPDLLVIKDFENSSCFLFLFKNDRLEKVNYKATYLD